MDLGAFNNATGQKGSGSSWIMEIIISLSAVVILYLALGSLNALNQYFNRLAINRTPLLPLTYSTEDKSYQISQNPNMTHSKTIHLSDNERTGIEFTYSFFLMVHPSTFRQEEGLLHIFHKGVPGQFPLLGPGVYMCSQTNTLRVYMNTFESWNTYADVDNFPVGKWVHVAVSCHSTHMEIYVNGNLKKRLGFNGFLPYQNYQDICAFSQRHIKLPATLPSLNGGSFEVFGVMKGMLSRLLYFNYALSYTEINALMNQGPSKQIASAQGGMPPPYLEDTWWTTNY